MTLRDLTMVFAGACGAMAGGVHADHAAMALALSAAAIAAMFAGIRL